MILLRVLFFLVIASPFLLNYTYNQQGVTVCKYVMQRRLIVR